MLMGGKKSLMRRVLQWRFWLNFAVVLAVTSWIPLLAQKAVLSDRDGTVLSETLIKVPVWRSWSVLFTHGPGAGHGLSVAIHLGLCLAVTFAVWLIVLMVRSDAPVDKQKDNEND